jgi:hypothetical protein
MVAQAAHGERIDLSAHLPGDVDHHRALCDLLVQAVLDTRVAAAAALQGRVDRLRGDASGCACQVRGLA